MRGAGSYPVRRCALRPHSAALFTFGLAVASGGTAGEQKCRRLQAGVIGSILGLYVDCE
jgi:hypothetical protein